jgi:hypothetical protein
MKSRYYYRHVLPGYLKVAIPNVLRWTGVVGHARWCCVSKHSACAKEGGCDGSCNCNARRDKRFG